VAAVIKGETVTEILATVVAALVFMIVGVQSTKGQNTAATATQIIDTVTYCELIEKPDRYYGKAVRVTATYSVGTHDAIFFDDACHKQQDRPNSLTVAKFVEDSDEAHIRNFEMLSKALKKYKTQQVQLTVIAVFGDEYSPVIHAGCCRYRLEVKQLLAVERVKPNSVTGPKMTQP
jgi:lipocalin